MAGSRDLAAVEAEELASLRREADRKRAELGVTLQALSSRLGEAGSLPAWAERGAEWVAVRMWHTAKHAVRRLPPGGTAPAALARARLLRGHGRQAALIGTGAGIAAAAAAGWLLHERRRRARRARVGGLRPLRARG